MGPDHLSLSLTRLTSSESEATPKTIPNGSIFVYAWVVGRFDDVLDDVLEVVRKTRSCCGLQFYVGKTDSIIATY